MLIYNITSFPVAQCHHLFSSSLHLHLEEFGDHRIGLQQLSPFDLFPNQHTAVSSTIAQWLEISISPPFAFGDLVVTRL